MGKGFDIEKQCACRLEAFVFISDVPAELCFTAVAASTESDKKCNNHFHCLLLFRQSAFRGEKKTSKPRPVAHILCLQQKSAFPFSDKISLSMKSTKKKRLTSHVCVSMY